MPKMRIAGLNEEQVMHAMSIDDAYRVERVLARRTTEAGEWATELVTIDDAGPFVRKRIPLQDANHAMWAAFAECSHPRLPQVAITYKMPDQFIVVYDYIPGDTLEHAVASRGRLDASDAVAVLREVCEAVSVLHEHGILHCDIAPKNIILAADGAHLIDFENARMIGQKASSGIARRGTWGFAAPEQYGFAQPDKRSDIYALARLLGYMLCGAAPNPDDGAYESLLADESVVPASLRAVVERGSAFEPSARYQTIAELVQAAACTAEGESPAQADAGARLSASMRDGTAPKPSAPSPARGGLGIGARIALIAGIVLAAIGCIAAAALWFSDAAPFARDSQTPSQSANAESTIPEKAAPAPEKTAPLPENAEASQLFIAESGWDVDGSGYISYGFALRNASDANSVSFPEIRITGRDARGAVVFSDVQVLSGVNAGQTVYCGGIAGNGTPPDSVEFVVEEPDDLNISNKEIYSAVLSVSGVSEVSNGFGGSNFVGEVRLEGGEYPELGMSDVAVTVILRDDEGNIVYGATDYTSRPALGESVPFEVLSGSLPAYVTIEAHAQPR